MASAISNPANVPPNVTNPDVLLANRPERFTNGNG
jgi:hypothetical protein